MPKSTSAAPQVATNAGLWAKLAEIYAVYAEAHPSLKLDPHNPPMRLAAMLRLTTDHARNAMLEESGYSLSAWRKWCMAPVNFPSPMLGAVIAHWEERSGERINLSEVWLPLPIKS